MSARRDLLKDFHARITPLLIELYNSSKGPSENIRRGHLATRAWKKCSGKSWNFSQLQGRPMASLRQKIAYRLYDICNDATVSRSLVYWHSSRTRANDNDQTTLTDDAKSACRNPSTRRRGPPRRKLLLAQQNDATGRAPTLETRWCEWPGQLRGGNLVNKGSSRTGSPEPMGRADSFGN